MRNSLGGSSADALALPSSIAMSGTILTRSLRKSNRCSDMMHCLRWDVERVFAFLLLVMLLDLVSKLSTNNSSVREMITGTAWAIFPTSSSACMIRLIRPWAINKKFDEKFAFFCCIVFTSEFRHLRRRRTERSSSQCGYLRRGSVRCIFVFLKAFLWVVSSCLMEINYYLGARLTFFAL